MGILYRAQTLVCSRRASTIAHIYPSVLQALAGRSYVGPLGRVILGCWGVAMQDPGYELRRIPIPRRWVNKALSDALGSLEWHPTLTACILSLHCDSAGLADKEEQSCHTPTRGLISPTRTMMPASTSATCSPSLSRRTQAGPSSSWTCIRP